MLRNEPESFFSRAKGKIIGGITGFIGGALVGGGVGSVFGGVGIIPGAIIGGFVGMLGVGMPIGHYARDKRRTRPPQLPQAVKTLSAKTTESKDSSSSQNNNNAFLQRTFPLSPFLGTSTVPTEDKKKEQEEREKELKLPSSSTSSFDSRVPDESASRNAWRGFIVAMLGFLKRNSTGRIVGIDSTKRTRHLTDVLRQNNFRFPEYFQKANAGNMVLTTESKTFAVSKTVDAAILKQNDGYSSTVRSRMGECRVVQNIRYDGQGRLLGRTLYGGMAIDSSNDNRLDAAILNVATKLALAQEERLGVDKKEELRGKFVEMRTNHKVHTLSYSMHDVGFITNKFLPRQTLIDNLSREEMGNDEHTYYSGLSGESHLQYALRDAESLKLAVSNTYLVELDEKDSTTVLGGLKDDAAPKEYKGQKYQLEYRPLLSCLYPQDYYYEHEFYVGILPASLQRLVPTSRENLNEEEIKLVRECLQQATKNIILRMKQDIQKKQLPNIPGLDVGLSAEEIFSLWKKSIEISFTGFVRQYPGIHWDSLQAVLRMDQTDLFSLDQDLQLIWGAEQANIQSLINQHLLPGNNLETVTVVVEEKKEKNQGPATPPTTAPTTTTTTTTPAESPNFFEIVSSPEAPSQARSPVETKTQEVKSTVHQQQAQTPLRTSPTLTVPSASSRPETKAQEEKKEVKLSQAQIEAKARLRETAIQAITNTKITMDIYKEPIIAVDGFLYDFKDEYEGIHNRSSYTRENLTGKPVFEYKALREFVQVQESNAPDAKKMEKLLELSRDPITGKIMENPCICVFSAYGSRGSTIQQALVCDKSSLDILKEKYALSGIKTSREFAELRDLIRLEKNTLEQMSVSTVPYVMPGSIDELCGNFKEKQTGSVSLSQPYPSSSSSSSSLSNPSMHYVSPVSQLAVSFSSSQYNNYQALDESSSSSSGRHPVYQPNRREASGG